MYAATYDSVWRTAAPVYAVTGEAAPKSNALAVRVWPNPTGGRATLSVALATPERVRVVVYDARGREVAVAHDGPAVDGQRFAVETAGLAPGTYAVRATSASGAAIARLTVVR